MSSSDRREFLARLSASALFLSAHGPAGFAALGLDSPARPPARDTATDTARDPGPRLLALRLETASPLEAMADFYGRTLGLPVEALADPAGERLLVTAGATQITFIPATDPASEPFYHFAFNIPENKILAARFWQLERGQSGDRLLISNSLPWPEN